MLILPLDIEGLQEDLLAEKYNGKDIVDGTFKELLKKANGEC